MEFRGAGQIGESIKRGQNTLSGVQVIAENAQRLASDLNGFGRTPTAETAKPAPATNASAVTPPLQGTNQPPAASKPVDQAAPPAAKRR
jgi:hypothetical protein